MRVTALYAGLLTLLYLALTARIILYRRRHRIDMGDADDPLLRRYVRGHANCIEYVPLGLLLLALLELGGRPGWLLQLCGLMLLVGRLAHAWSFSTAPLREPSRVLGMTLTLGMLTLAALACLAQGAGLG